MPKPKSGEVVVVEFIPNCDFCVNQPGNYDFKTLMGPWAHGCFDHWMQYRVSPTLGVGKGQLWITKEEVDV